ncbi:MAG: acyl-CoA dehydrogenase family protein [Deltaproteobacteria bacterium]|nr:acyl-CoA dehydrogenase family protein [Deltaproteobacteria bacterium]
MDFRLNPEQEAFQKEFVSWLEKNLPDGWDPSRYPNFESGEELADAYKDLQGRLFKAGYAGMYYPKAYGGQGKSVMEEAIVLEAMAAACMEIKNVGLITHGMIAPTILTCGSEAQKQEFLSRILDGTHIWCQGFSEPDAGSDVANVSTRAERQDNHYIVNGQKVWTSVAQLSDYCMLLVRTDPQVKKHKGLSYLLVDMKLPGVEVRPTAQITGEAEFNEIFFDNVRVPVDMRVGEEGQGWQIAITTLMFERTVGDVTMAAALGQKIDLMIEMAQKCKRSGKPVIEDPIFRQRLGQAYIDTMVTKYHGLRSLNHLIRGGIPGPEGSVGKLLWSEFNQRICEAAINMQGPGGQLMSGSAWGIHDGYWQFHYLRSRGNTIEAGTSEIQRNIIGERVLELPKDMSRVNERQGG